VPNNFAWFALTIRKLQEAVAAAITAPIVTSDIGDAQVTYAKIQDVSAASKLLGRGDSGAGDVQEIALGTNLSITGTTLNASGGGSTPTGTGFRHITAGAEDAAAKLVDTADINNDQVTFGKIQNISTARILGRTTAASGDIEELSAGSGISIASGQIASSITQYTDELAQDAIGNILLDTATIDLVYDDATPTISANVIDNSISNVKLGDMAQGTIKGRAVGAGTGDPTDLTATQATAILDIFTSALKGLVPASGGGTTNFLRADGTFAAPPSGSGSATNIEKDLGSVLATQGHFTITDASISPTSKILISQANGPYTGKGTRADEAEMDLISVIAYPGTGSARVYWKVQGYVSSVPERWSRTDRLSITLASANNPADDFRTRNFARQIGLVRGNVKFNYMVL